MKNLKEKLIEKFKKNGLEFKKDYKLRYYKNGSRLKWHKTGKEECFIYKPTGTEEYTFRGKRVKTNGMFIDLECFKSKEYMEYFILELKHYLSLKI